MNALSAESTPSVDEDMDDSPEALPGERVTLTDELTIYVAGERVAQLQHALHRCGTLTIDLSGITEIDTAGVQVLAFIRREAATRDRPLVYVDHSPVVLDALQLLGLDLQLETAVKPGARP